jgi:hypothetical protein
MWLAAMLFALALGGAVWLVRWLHHAEQCTRYYLHTMMPKNDLAPHFWNGS